MRLIAAIAVACLCVSSFGDLQGVEAVKRKGKVKGDRWFSVTEEDTGKLYFWNKATGEVTWTRPKGAKVRPGVKFHSHKKSRNNARTAPPPTKSKQEQNQEKRRQAEEQASAAQQQTAANEEEEEEFELFDEEGDVIPPPPPAISYVLIGAGVLGLGLVGAVFFVNSRRDAKLAKEMYKTR